MPITQITECLDIRGKQQNTKLSFSDTPQETGAWNDPNLVSGGIGVYYMWSTVNAYLLHKLATGGTEVTADTGVMLLANSPISIKIRQGDILRAKAASVASGELHFILLYPFS